MLREQSWTTLASILALAVSPSASAQTTTRVSVDSIGSQANDYSTWASISADGRFVAFHSAASNLVAGDTNGATDVFVHDRLAGTTTRISVDSNGLQGDSDSDFPSISADGQYIAFRSTATNLVPGDTNGQYDCFVRDRLSKTTARVSVSSAGAQATTGTHAGPRLSADGRFVTFGSQSTNLVLGDTNGVSDAFVRDLQASTTERVSLDSSEAQVDDRSDPYSISGDGRYVVFGSQSPSLVPGDANGDHDIFVRDRLTGSTARVSVSSLGVEGNDRCIAAVISSDGRFVAFESWATNLVIGDTNGFQDVFVHDRQSGTTERASLDSDEVEANGDTHIGSMSSDGHYVAFFGLASSLAPGDSNSDYDIFVRDCMSGTTTRVSLDASGFQGDGDSSVPSLSGDGRFVAFSSAAALVASDTNGSEDVFVRDRGEGYLLTPFCFGDGSGIPCPCGNTGGSGRGCNNSISSGGAVLSGTGQARVSSDTLQLTSSGERPTALSLFWQGGSEVPQRVFGDGLGCMGSPLKRLYFRNAIGGVVGAPQGADLSISARSAALGNPIVAGSTRVYHVFYRDPDLNFCPAPLGSTHNTTNGLRVLWGQ